MKRIWFWTVLMGVAAGAGVQAEPRGYQGPGFTATRVETVGRDRETSTIYMSRHGMREEAGVPGRRLIYVTDLRSGKAWVLDERRRTYQELGRAAAAAERDSAQAEAGTLLDTRPCRGFDLTKRLGRDRVAGRDAEVWVCGDSRTRRQVKQWFDRKLGLVIKEMTPDRWSAELRDIRMVKQAPDRFRIPDGFKPGPVGR